MYQYQLIISLMSEREQIITIRARSRYHRQQNKCYSQRCLLAHFEATLYFSQICYCGQISLQSVSINYSFSDNLTPWGVSFILLVMVNIYFYFYESVLTGLGLWSLRKSLRSPPESSSRTMKRGSFPKQTPMKWTMLGCRNLDMMSASIRKSISAWLLERAVRVWERMGMGCNSIEFVEEDIQIQN